ncbi:hypothetical protein [Halalkalicoccus jeotgali]|uniref:DUF8052 domain-containing protein n=1 Tax=Halalkalicoccus jeotgali (strain DSM 18796 / CECT 7217 / JCM 14584 / KCTC 4019 / B3) TaxID=795797 RepID=D8J4A8_HALJB|nr:hypothetical protein [Halalkalicoccus jeotgali]ADJ13470.1 hypothetical protein HacjB3_00385 [Halalkalicoccus jeotgali B3]ELY33055.1 hypothetical protein C497_18947 [Halalkalicoccus jeotgali B3]
MSPEAVPEYDDPFLDRVARRLATNYDLDRDVRVRGERFDLHGELSIRNQKQFLHPSISFARHDSTEHLLARRVGTVREADLDGLVELGHELADEWIVPADEHFSTDFTFALVADALGEGVREYVSGFSDRTLLKFGYHGHYEINLLVVVPSEEQLVASENADVAAAFATWDPIEREKSGLLSRLANRLR